MGWTKNIAMLTLAAVVQLAGCIDVTIGGELRRDGSGLVDVHYVVVKEFFFGKYGQIETNNLLPLDADGVRAFAANYPGVQLLSVQVADAGQTKTPQGKTLNLLSVQYRLGFNDINVFRTNHFRFAYYPFEDAQYFQFRIDKRMPQPGEMPEARPDVNPLATGITKGRKLDLGFYMSDRVLDSNGEQVAHSTVKWSIPIAEIVGGRKQTLVAWAKLPKQSDPGLYDRLKLALALEPWKAPASFLSLDRWPPQALESGAAPTP